MRRHYVRGDAETRWRAKYREDESGCWLWIGAPNGAGYGTFHPTQQQKVYAHRFGYELEVGPIPDGIELDHLCRVRLCVNPSHLEAVTRQVNQHRGFGPSGINARKTHCLNGHELTDDNLVRGAAGRACKTCHRDRQRFYYQQKVRRAV